MALTPQQITQYYQTEGKKANPLSPLAWAAQQGGTTTPATPAVSPMVAPKTAVPAPIIPKTTVTTPTAQTQAGSQLTPQQRTAIQGQISTIQPQLADLQAQSEALKKYGATDTNQLMKNADGTYSLKPANKSIPEPGAISNSLQSITGSSEGDPQTQLAAYIAKINRQTAALPDTYKSLMESTGVNTATKALGTTQQEITKTQALIDNLESNINSRIGSLASAGGAPVTEAQRQRQLAGEQRPLAQTLGTQQQLASTQQAGLSTAQQLLAQQYAGAKDQIANEAGMLPYLQSLMEYQSPQQKLAMQIAQEKKYKELGLGDYAAASAQPKYETVGAGQTLVDPATGKVVYQAPEKDTTSNVASIQEYEYAKKQGYTGTYNDYQNLDANRKISIAKAGATASASGLTSGQASMFNSLVAKYNSSPLIAASDRTPVLRASIAEINKDPSNAAKQLNLVYSYIQALDTYQSAVREGELSLVNSIDSKAGQLGNYTTQIMNGQIVRPEVAKQIAAAAEQLVTTISTAAAAKAKSYNSQANVVGLGDTWSQYMSGFTPSYTSGTGGAQTSTQTTGDPKVDSLRQKYEY